MFSFVQGVTAKFALDLRGDFLALLKLLGLWKLLEMEYYGLCLNVPPKPDAVMEGGPFEGLSLAFVIGLLSSTGIGGMSAAPTQEWAASI